MPDNRLFLKLAATHQYLVRILDRHLTPVGIPPYQLGLVTHIRHNQPVTPSAVSRASGAPPTTLRDNIQRLVDLRLVRRLPNPDDRRSYLLELTDRGEVMARAADPVLAEAYAALDRLLPDALGVYEARVDELNRALEEALAAEPIGSRRA